MKMCASTSSLLDTICAASFAISLSFIGVLTFANPVRAGSLIGEFQLNGGFTSLPTIEENSLVELSATSLIFSPQPITPVALSAQTGNFKLFNSANIGNIINFSPLSADNPFIDFGKTLLPGIIQSSDDTASITDGINSFILKSANYALKQSGANVAIDVALYGLFQSADGIKSQGAGSLSFQANDVKVANVQSILNSGGSVKNLAFAGALFTTTSVPEPTTILGLGIVGAALVMSRRPKNRNNSIHITRI